MKSKKVDYEPPKAVLLDDTRTVMGKDPYSCTGGNQDPEPPDPGPGGCQGGGQAEYVCGGGGGVGRYS